MLLSALLFSQLAASCAPGGPLGVLTAIAKVESGFDTLAIHDNTEKQNYRPSDQAEAIEIAERMLSEGHSVDLGLMQINSKNLPALRLSTADSFDACKSIHAGAEILRNGYVSALKTAISRYNTGSDTKGMSNGYVAKVMAENVPDIGARVEQYQKFGTDHPEPVRKPVETTAPTDKGEVRDLFRRDDTKGHDITNLYSDPASTSDGTER